MARTVLGVMLLLAGVLASPASADPRVDTMVTALRKDPVLVSTAMVRAVAPAELARLRRAVAAAPFPVYVAIVPSFGDQPGLETLDALPDLLHDRLERDGVYLAVPQSGYPSVQAFGVRPRFDPEDLGTAIDDDRPDAFPGEVARYAVELLATGRRAAVAERPVPGEEPVQVLPVLAAGLGSGALAFVVAGWPWLQRRRRQAGHAAAPAGLADARPAPLDADGLRAQAREELTELSAGLAAAHAPRDAAFEAYAAASKALDDERHPVDLVGALALARAGRAVLAGRAPATCFFDPRHSGPTAPTRWAFGREEATLPACRRCAKAIARHRAPVALEDRGRPYFEQDTVWARTGFGALDDELPARVLAGEARR